MTVYSEARRNLSPRMQSFYHNFQLVRMNQSWHHSWDDVWKVWTPFSMLGWSFHSYFAYAPAYRNWGIQVFETGSFHPEIVLWSAWENFSPPHPTPRSAVTGQGDWHYGQKDIPAWAYNYPRPTFKVRRSYWTGKPRRRRNI